MGLNLTDRRIGFAAVAAPPQSKKPPGLSDRFPTLRSCLDFSHVSESFMHDKDWDRETVGVIRFIYRESNIKILYLF